MPMSTKKMGTKNDEMGWISSSSAMLTAVHEVAVVDVLEDEAGGERADDRSEADDVREPREEKAKRQTNREKHAAGPELGRQEKSLGERCTPRTREPPRNPVALPSIRPMSAPESAPPPIRGAR